MRNYLIRLLPQVITRRCSANQSNWCVDQHTPQSAWPSAVFGYSHVAERPGAVSRLRFVQPNSPWPAPFPPPPPPMAAHCHHCSGLPWYYEAVRLPTPVHPWRVPLGFPGRTSAIHERGTSLNNTITTPGTKLFNYLRMSL